MSKSRRERSTNDEAQTFLFPKRSQSTEEVRLSAGHATNAAISELCADLHVR